VAIHGKQDTNQIHSHLSTTQNECPHRRAATDFAATIQRHEYNYYTTKDGSKNFTRQSEAVHFSGYVLADEYM